ncbi:MAG TPA: hypothetical protein VGK64_22350 [Bryobacteraceae bacterium]
MSAPSAPPPVRPGGFLKWHQRVLGIFLIVVAFEVGLVLLIAPWLARWETSWVPTSPRLAAIWVSPYFRGALSGLGLLNLYVSLNEAARQIAALFTKNNG